MPKRKSRRWTRKRLIALGVPAVLIPGLLIAMVLGWNPAKLTSVKNYHQIKTVFPTCRAGIRLNSKMALGFG